MQSTLNRNEIVEGIRRLNVIERLNIVTDIWDEIKESQELENISDNEKKILLKRLANYRDAPDSAKDWSDLKQEIYKKYAEKS